VHGDFWWGVLAGVGLTVGPLVMATDILLLRRRRRVSLTERLAPYRTEPAALVTVPLPVQAHRPERDRRRSTLGADYPHMMN